MLNNVRQSCTTLGISRTTFYQLVAAGKIRTVRLGPRMTRVSAAEIERIISEGGF
jgi:excisionase family DNA binding protein